MRKTTLFLAMMATGLTVTTAQADQPGRNGCPPGLAKKHNGCLPPGIAKKRYGRGDYINDGYVVVRHPGRYGLDPDQTYYRVGDYIYRVDRDTREVLDLIGAVARVLD
ncbi:excinuclease ABC subunit A [Roseovarius sp. PS-C2]|uniref:excinuclease ABC subunit A n=1 Tax=Roseovarius sp. PS-C2 TaxID=2820814 RepID=UPI00209AB018|nr:excinuclease ABC subunit A [Roseovarius sp. PS-C2]